jgi:hypothetical protein
MNKSLEGLFFVYEKATGVGHEAWGVGQNLTQLDFQVPDARCPMPPAFTPSSETTLGF